MYDSLYIGKVLNNWLLPAQYDVFGENVEFLMSKWKLLRIDVISLNHAHREQKEEQFNID